MTRNSVPENTDANMDDSTYLGIVDVDTTALTVADLEWMAYFFHEDSYRYSVMLSELMARTKLDRVTIIRQVEIHQHGMTRLKTADERMVIEGDIALNQMLEGAKLELALHTGKRVIERTRGRGE
jgi:hypothetical protein